MRLPIDRSPRRLAHSLQRYVLPSIASRPVSDVSSAGALAILTPILHVKADTARRLRLRIGAVLEWAVAMEHRIDNPCDRIGSVLGLQREIVRHMRALPHREVAAALEKILASRSTHAVKLVFDFLVVTAAPSGEMRLARWKEFDLAGRVWTIPVERMTMRREHRLQLSPRAVEILDAALLSQRIAPAQARRRPESNWTRASLSGTSGKPPNPSSRRTPRLTSRCT